eukprot:6456056-Alexandrium_andersonii.AAC.1
MRHLNPRVADCLLGRYVAMRTLPSMRASRGVGGGSVEIKLPLGAGGLREVQALTLARSSGTFRGEGRCQQSRASGWADSSPI